MRSRHTVSRSVWYAIACAMASTAVHGEPVLEFRQAVVAPGTPAEVLNDPEGWLAPVSVDFSDVPLNEVVAALAAHMQRNIVIDPRISSERITLIAHHPIPRYEARALLESLLNSRGYALVENVGGVLLEIRPIDQATEKLDIVVHRGNIERDRPDINEAFAANDGVLRVGNAYLQLGSSAAVWAGTPDELEIVDAGEVAAGLADFGAIDVVVEGTAIRAGGVDVSDGWTAVGAPSDGGFILLLVRRAPIDRATARATRGVAGSTGH